MGTVLGAGWSSEHSRCRFLGCGSLARDLRFVVRTVQAVLDFSETGMIQSSDVSYMSGVKYILDVNITVFALCHHDA